MRVSTTNKVTKNFIYGYYDDFHPDPAVNFQLNRWLNYLGPESLSEIQDVASKLTDFNAFSNEFIRLGDRALKEGKNLNAGFYYRSAEFFMFSDNPKKQFYRNQFLKLVRSHYNLINKINLVPFEYKGRFINLHSYRFTPDNPKDTIVVFGGSDSYIEEFLPVLIPITEKGFEVILFEGPGQGCVLEDYKVPLTPDWHKPVKAILDYYNLNDVTLMGISAGGCLVMRAAAFEERVKRVVAYDVLLKGEVWTEKLNPSIRWLLKTLLKLKSKKIINALFNAKIKNNLQLQWGVRHAAHIYGGNTAYDYLQGSQLFTTEDVSSKISQDVLLLAGNEDFGVPLWHFYKQIEILKNVRSLTARLFTRAEQAHNHCQVGNLELALKTILDWITTIKATSTV